MVQLRQLLVLLSTYCSEQQHDYVSTVEFNTRIDYNSILV